MGWNPILRCRVGGWRAGQLALKGLQTRLVVLGATTLRHASAGIEGVGDVLGVGVGGQRGIGNVEPDRSREVAAVGGLEAGEGFAESFQRGQKVSNPSRWAEGVSVVDGLARGVVGATGVCGMPA